MGKNEKGQKCAKRANDTGFEFGSYTSSFTSVKRTHQFQFVYR